MSVDTRVNFRGGAALERPGFCARCHRALKDPRWVAYGMGPVCAKKRAAAIAQAEEDMRAMAAAR